MNKRDLIVVANALLHGGLGKRAMKASLGVSVLLSFRDGLQKSRLAHLEPVLRVLGADKLSALLILDKFDVHTLLHVALCAVIIHPIA